MEELVVRMASQYGFNAILVAVLLVQTWYLERKMLSLVENNTRAMVELKAVIEMHRRNGRDGRDGRDQ
jgi:hypothetical protein